MRIDGMAWCSRRSCEEGKKSVFEPGTHTRGHRCVRLTIERPPGTIGITSRPLTMSYDMPIAAGARGIRHTVSLFSSAWRKHAKLGNHAPNRRKNPSETSCYVRASSTANIAAPHIISHHQLVHFWCYIERDIATHRKL